MRNLCLCDISVTSGLVKCEDSQSKEGRQWLVSPHPDTEASYICTGDACWIAANSQAEKCEAVSRLFDDGEVVGVEWLADQQALCIFTRDGTVLLYRDGNEQLEPVTSLCPDVEAVAWSGDQELVAVVAAGPILLLATPSGETIAEQPVFSQQFGEMEPVTVGWGRKETQFHGSAGKAAARTQLTPDDVTGDADDDGRARISWRGDGQMLTVGAVCPTSGGRRFVVFSRSGQRLSTSEPVPGLGAALAWRPSGAEIAAVQTLPNKLQLVFFEKNGLRHGQFTLPLPPGSANVRELLWSTDSAVLAVWLEMAGDAECRIQFWTAGNYHWYCKHEYRLPCHDRPRAIAWHPSRHCSLQVATSGGRLVTLSFQWRPSCGGGGATAAVVDGARLLVTPLAAALVPPPMSAHELLLPAAVNAVCQTPAGTDRPWLIAVTSDHCLHAFRQLVLGETPLAPSSDALCTVRVTAGAGPECGFSVRAPLHQYRGSCRLPAAAAAGWAWQLVAADRLVCAVHTQQGPRLLVVVVRLPAEAEPAVISITERLWLPLESPVVSISATADSAEALVHTWDGRFLVVNTEEGGSVPLTDPAGEEVVLPVPAQQVVVVSCGGGRRCVVALTSQRRLYADGRELLAGCTSFTVSDDFLLVTTLEHSLRCLPLSALADVAKLGATSEIWSSVSSRRLERGARLVAAVPRDTRVVLQMPRGNLELVHPRPLVISRVATLMDRGEYRPAYAEMRRHRISLNLLVDHAPDTFADRCSHVCRCLIAEPNWLCVFVSELSEDDVTQTLYGDMYGGRPDAAAVWSPAGGKVDRVCELVRQALEELDRRRLMLPILTTLVRHTTPRLEQALRVISTLRDDSPAEGAVTADAALRYLVVLVDVDELYTVALGTYDFDLVVMVAEKSQKDPKEYLPFLNGLRALPDRIRKYRVDCHLRRWEAALGHLAAAGPDHHQEALKLISDHGLHRVALQLYQAGTPEYKAVCGLYADHLSELGHHWEAGTFYTRAGAQTSAVDALRTAGAWRDCLRTGTQAGISGEQLRQLAASLADDQRAAGRYADAAELHERHLRQPEQQVSCLLEGRLWSAAVQACHQARRPHLIGLQVVPALERAVAVISETVQRISEMLRERCTRLQVVRELIKQQHQRRGLLPDGDAGAADADLYSDTSSVSNLTGGSASSGRTHQSSKSRRKQERKRYSLREGSGTEDLALVVACHALISEAYALIEDVGSLLRALVQHKLDCTASELQAAFSRLLSEVEVAVPRVWQPSVSDTERTAFGPGQTANAVISMLRGGGDGVAAPDRIALLEPHLRYPPMARRDTSWRLLCLERPAATDR